MPKKIKIPRIIAALVKAKNSRDSKAVAACFDADAIVQDEGKKMRGVAAIEKWSANTFKKYQYTTDPTNIVENKTEIVMTATLTGNFPGSPVSLDYHFTLKKGKILSLEIK